MSCLTLAIQFDRLFLPTAFRMLALRPLRFSPEGFTTCQAFTPCHASGLSGCTCGAVCLPCLPSIVYRRPPYGVHCYFDGCMACRHTATVSPVLNGCLSRNLALFVSCPHSWLKIIDVETPLPFPYPLLDFVALFTLQRVFRFTSVRTTFHSLARLRSFRRGLAVDLALFGVGSMPFPNSECIRRRSPSLFCPSAPPIAHGDRAHGWTFDNAWFSRSECPCSVGVNLTMALYREIRLASTPKCDV